MSRRLVRASRRGFTLLEAMIGGALLAVLLGLAMGLFYNVNRDVGEGLAIADAAAQANRVAKEIQRRLAAATQLELGAPAGGSFRSVSFRVVEGYDFSTGEAKAGEAYELRFAKEPSEALGRIELVHPGSTVTLIEGIEPTGFSFRFQRADGTLSNAQVATDEDVWLRVTFVRRQRLPRQGDVHQERRELLIALRNPPTTDE